MGFFVYGMKLILLITLLLLYQCVCPETLTDWFVVGQAGIGDGTASWQSLAFNPTTNEPYVAFSDDSNDCKASVMKFNGSNCEYVGASNFTDGTANGISLVFNPKTAALPIEIRIF